MQKEALGIPDSEVYYLKVKDSQGLLTHFKHTRDFVVSVVGKFAKDNNLDLNKMSVKFINYGDTQLVYVISHGEDKYAMLVGQPATEFGVVKREYELLNEFAKRDKCVVNSNSYYSEINDLYKKEAYITKYYNQARCIASQNSGFGVYVPEPTYHFEKFNIKESYIVNACMIAKLIALYDSDKNRGIACCKVGGGDFMLEKTWDRDNINETDTLENLKLIALRDTIECSLDEYIDLIRKEFSKRTYYKNESERDKSIKINQKARVGMGVNEIEYGIRLGLQLRRIANMEKYGNYDDEIE